MLYNPSAPLSVGQRLLIHDPLRGTNSEACFVKKGNNLGLALLWVQFDDDGDELSPVFVQTNDQRNQITVLLKEEEK